MQEYELGRRCFRDLLRTEPEAVADVYAEEPNWVNVFGRAWVQGFRDAYKEYAYEMYLATVRE